ncbi:hypothetical protein BACI9J_650001 [Bacillus altitudinis]|nr:hypothetical protein BACI9J_650001 [Bacillus altitudinis]
MVEHRTFNPRVVGSSPTGPTVAGIEGVSHTASRTFPEQSRRSSPCEQ